MIVCVDGPNFAGKTTIIKNVKAKVSDLIIIEDTDIFALAQQLGDFRRARLRLQQIYDFSDKRKNFLICRWFPSMYVFDAITEFSGLIVPDYTFIILSDLKRLKMRQKIRGNFCLNMGLEKQIKKYKEYVKNFDCICVRNRDVKDVQKISELIVSCFSQ